MTPVESDEYPEVPWRARSMGAASGRYARLTQGPPRQAPRQRSGRGLETNCCPRSALRDRRALERLYHRRPVAVGGPADRIATGEIGLARVGSLGEQRLDHGGE